MKSPYSPGQYVPPRSRAQAPHVNDAQRTRLGTAFSELTDVYHAVRPAYPAEVSARVHHLIRHSLTAAEEPHSLIAAKAHLSSAPTIVDIGAGTGILTDDLLATDLPVRVLALDPSHEMLSEVMQRNAGNPRFGGAVCATAEALPFPDASLAAITCAQAWHWVDVSRASRECARVLQPGGAGVLVWNELDVRVPWVHRFSRIAHSGDIHTAGFVPNVGPALRIVSDDRLSWEDHLTPEQLIDLARTRSYWQRSNAATRAKVETNLRWYLFEHLELAPGEPVTVPYVCSSFTVVTR